MISVAADTRRLIVLVQIAEQNACHQSKLVVCIGMKRLLSEGLRPQVELGGALHRPARPWWQSARSDSRVLSVFLSSGTQYLQGVPSDYSGFRKSWSEN
jgi:hypothetical protein